MEWGSGGAGGRPCSHLSWLCTVRVCVCQAVPVLPVRTGCELVAPCHILVPGGASWCLQGRLDLASTWAGVGDIVVVALWPPPRLLHCVCAGRGYGGACPFLPHRDEGNVCVCVHVCVCVYVCLCTRGTI